MDSSKNYLTNNKENHTKMTLESEIYKAPKKWVYQFYSTLNLLKELSVFLKLKYSGTVQLEFNQVQKVTVKNLS